MALIPRHFMNSVVAIGDRKPDGTAQWVGSGFFYGKRVKVIDNASSLFRTYLVTNKHVLAALGAPIVRANPSGNVPATEHAVDLTDEDGKPLWVGHPDPDIDVVVAGVALDPLREQGYEVDFIQDTQAARVSEMESFGMCEGDSVFLLGFPMGMIGESRSAAIVRGGTLARFRTLRDGHSKTMLIDGYVYPGNSGGPIFTKPEVMAITGTSAVSSAYLVGVVASYVPYEDVAISPQTQRVRVVFEENSGLTQAFPIDAIDEAIGAFETIHPLSTKTDQTEPADDEGPAAAQPSLGS